MKFLLPSIAILMITQACISQNVGINSDGSSPETSVMLDVKGTSTKSTAATQTVFQIKSSDASTDALKLRLGLITNATASLTCGFIEAPDYTANAVSAYRPLALQPSGGNVGVGTTSPDSEFEVICTQSTLPRGILSTQYNSAILSDAHVWLRKARGTEAAPTAVQSGDELGFIKFRGYGTSFSTNDQTEIGAVASETFTGTANGSYLKFMTTPNGTAAGIERMRIDQNGRVGIGAAIPSYTLDVNGTGRFTSDLYADTKVVLNADAANYYMGGTGVTNGYRMVTWDEIRLSFNGGGSDISFNNGWMGIGCNTPQYPLHVIGDIASSATVRSTNVVAVGAITACSDRRYKKDITPLTNTMENLTQLQGVNYHWKTDEFPGKHFSGTKQIGFIAQEIEKIYPEVVFTDSDGYKSVDYSRLTPVLVEAIKEQQKMIESLRKDVETLKNKETAQK